MTAESPGAVLYTRNHTTVDAEAGGLGVQEQLDLHGETLSLNTKTVGETRYLLRLWVGGLD